jgi:hypothetical protein
MEIAMKNIKELWKKRIFRMTVGIVVGATIGYLYYNFWGCHGSCPITGSSLKMVGFGIIFGTIWVN